MKTCEWVPGVILTVVLNRAGSDLISFTLIERPISVAIEQWGIVGVKVRSIVLFASSTSMRSSCKTLNFQMFTESFSYNGPSINMRHILCLQRSPVRISVGFCTKNIYTYFSDVDYSASNEGLFAHFDVR